MQFLSANGKTRCYLDSGINFPAALSYSTLLHPISMAATKVSCLQINGSVVKDPPANARDVGLIPGSGKCPCRRKWQPTPVFLPGESHEQRSLAGYSPWGRKELDTNEQLSAYTHTHTHINIPQGHRHINPHQNNSKPGTSLVVQWLGLHTPLPRTGLQSLVWNQDPASHMAKNIKTFFN